MMAEVATKHLNRILADTRQQVKFYTPLILQDACPRRFLSMIFRGRVMTKELPRFSWCATGKIRSSSYFHELRVERLSCLDPPKEVSRLTLPTGLWAVSK